MVGIGEKSIALQIEILPVIPPTPVEDLKLEKRGPVPFKNARVSRMVRIDIVPDDAEGKRQKMAAIEAEVTPLLGNQSRNRLELGPGASIPFENFRLGVRFIGHGAAGSGATGCQENLITDMEEFDVFAAGCRHQVILSELAVTPAINGHIDVAVADMHAGSLSGNILGKLRQREIQLARQVEWMNTPRAGGRQALMLTQRAMRGGLRRTSTELG